MAETPFDTLKRLRATYPTPMSSEQNAALLNDTAWAHRAANWGVYAKPSGSNCKRSDGVLISRDILCQLGSATGVDCLQDSEGAGIPVWSTGVPIEPTNWLASIAPAVEPPVPPQPIPQPPTTNYTQWVSVEMPMLAAAYREKHGNSPAPSDYAHLAWRRLVEHWTLTDMVKDI